ncbi:MAG TPA: PilZ domain-containing protein [Rhodoferax sp.]
MNVVPAESHRLFSRVPFSAAVTLHLPGKTLEVTLLDIALKGALVQTNVPEAIQLQAPCRLMLPLSNDGETIEMAGTVAHLNDCHVGLRCEHIDLTSLTLLRRLLELNTGDADLMDRELSQLFATRSA